MANPRRLTIELAETDAPALRGSDGTDELRRELMPLGGVEVSGSDRPHRRSIDPATLGQIVVTLSGVVGGLVPVVETVRQWVQKRAAARTVRLEIDGDVIEVSGLDSEAQQELVDRWLERHETPA